MKEKEMVQVQENEKVNKPFKMAIFLISLAAIVFGGLFVAFHVTALEVVCYAFGAALCIAGVVSIIVNFVNHKEENLFNSYGLVIGIALLAMGIVVLMNKDQVKEMLVTLFGALVIVDGALKLQHSVDMLRLKTKGWQAFMVAAFVVIILGVIVVIDPFKSAQALMIYTGIAMIVDGLIGVVNVIFIAKILKDLKEKPIEAAAEAVAEIAE